MLESIYIHGQLPCTIERAGSFTSEIGTEYSARSYLLVCPSCEAVWARLYVGGYILAHPAWCTSCAHSDDYHPVPGSILVELGYCIIDLPLLEALPEHLLRREFELHLRQAEKEIQNGN